VGWNLIESVGQGGLWAKIFECRVESFYVWGKVLAWLTWQTFPNIQILGWQMPMAKSVTAEVGPC